jgi:hypothetical protein
VDVGTESQEKTNMAEQKRHEIAGRVVDFEFGPETQAWHYYCADLRITGGGQGQPRGRPA